jgi:hypothetical protein
LDTIPEASEAHEMSVFSLDIMWDFVFGTILEPLKEALGNNDTAFAALDRSPHASRTTERVVPAVDCFHDCTIVRISLGPKRDEPPSH